MSLRTESQGKEDIAMQVKPAALGMMLTVGLLVGSLTAPSIAAQENAKETTLPRSFQGARLGMTLSELVTVVPDAKRVSLHRRDQAQHTVVIPSKDRSIQRVEYRFYNDHLRELAIQYNLDKLTDRYQRLRERLKESYGKPFVEDQKEDYERGLDIISVKKTIWKDGVTISSLVDEHNVLEDRRALTLTITDVNLQEAFEQDQEHRRHQRELSIPIPLPDHSMQNRRA
jgi:hypothetical protein